MERLKLNLGCGGLLLPGFVNIDRLGKPDLKLDLESAKLPFRAGAVDHVELNHALEHVGNAIVLLKEVHRVCADGATVHLKYPIGNVSFADPSHKHYWNEETVSYFCNGDYLGLPKFDLVSSELHSDRRIAFLPLFVRRILHVFTNRGFFECEATLRVVK